MIENPITWLLGDIALINDIFLAILRFRNFKQFRLNYQGNMWTKVLDYLENVGILLLLLLFDYISDM